MAHSASFSAFSNLSLDYLTVLADKASIALWRGNTKLLCANGLMRKAKCHRGGPKDCKRPKAGPARDQTSLRARAPPSREEGPLIAKSPRVSNTRGGDPI